MEAQEKSSSWTWTYRSRASGSTLTVICDFHLGTIAILFVKFIMRFDGL